jgi:phosphoglycolate phosphatase
MTMTTGNARQGVIFDLDGTIADTLRDIAESMNETLAAHGLPTHDLVRYKRVVGGGAKNLASLLLPQDKQHLIDELTREFRARYAERPIQHSRPYPGMLELLEALVTRGHPLAVLSNKPDHLTKPIVAQLFPNIAFVRVLGESPAYPRKPDPASALALSKDLGVAPNRCVLVGDTSIDVRTARAANMLPIGVRWGFHDPSELREAGARHLLGHPSELLDVLAALPA